MSTSPAARTKDELVRDFRTAAIVEAARRVIAEQGYAEASMERIARRAGVAKGTLYLYFDSKQSLLIRVLAHGHDEVLALSREAAARERDCEGRLRAVLCTLLAECAAQRGFLHALHALPWHRLGGDSPVAGQIRANVEDTVALLAKLLDEGARSGEFRPLDLDRAARYLVALLSSVIVQRVIEAESLDLDAEVEGLMDFALRGLRATAGRLEGSVR